MQIPRCARDDRKRFQSFKVSRFQGFKVSKTREGFKVSKTREGFKVSELQGFRSIEKRGNC
jgi:hypothetical protein